MELATQGRGEKPSYYGTAVTFSQSVQCETKEHVRIVEENLQLGEERFEAAWNQGRSMKIHEAIDYTLGLSQD